MDSLLPTQFMGEISDEIQFWKGVDLESGSSWFGGQEESGEKSLWIGCEGLGSDGGC